MRLVVSEKPSVARSIAAVLGATQKQKGYLEGNNYLVSWCVGHLVELAAPAAYDEKYAKWSTAIATAALCYGETIIFFHSKEKGTDRRYRNGAFEGRARYGQGAVFSQDRQDLRCNRGAGRYGRVIHQFQIRI